MTIVYQELKCSCGKNEVQKVQTQMMMQAENDKSTNVHEFAVKCTTIQ